MSKPKRIFIIVILFFAFGYYKSCSDKKDEKTLVKNGKIVTAKVLYPYKEKARLGTRLLYVVPYNSENKYSREYENLTTQQGEAFTNKYFPAIIIPSKSNINRILIFPSDFKEFNLEFPVSLAWVKKYE